MSRNYPNMTAVQEFDLLASLAERLLFLQRVINEGKPSYAHLEESNYALQKALADNQREGYRMVWLAVRNNQGRRLTVQKSDLEAFDSYGVNFLRVEEADRFHFFAIKQMGDAGTNFDFSGIEPDSIRASIDPTDHSGAEVLRLLAEWQGISAEAAKASADALKAVRQKERLRQRDHLEAARKASTSDDKFTVKTDEEGQDGPIFAPVPEVADELKPRQDLEGQTLQKPFVLAPEGTYDTETKIDPFPIGNDPDAPLA